MELPLQLRAIPKALAWVFSFNPCFNGTTSATNTDGTIAFGATSFNPCFNGTTSATGKPLNFLNSSLIVSILVLMELPLQPN